jgi:hypothetical protein
MAGMPDGPSACAESELDPTKVLCDTGLAGARPLVISVKIQYGLASPWSSSWIRTKSRP